MGEVGVEVHSASYRHRIPASPANAVHESFRILILYAIKLKRLPSQAAAFFCTLT